MSTALLVELYRQLPELRPDDDPDLWEAHLRDAMRAFRRRVRRRYTEGTLQRLLASESVECRRAAVLALGLVGTFDSNAALARMLRDEDSLVARTAADALWEVWFRGGTQDQNELLQEILRLPDFQQMLAAMDELAREAPEFAEAFNQRAILYFRAGEFRRSIEDCERALRLNPYHFGAASGMGQCYLKLSRPRAALRAFRLALEINPTLENLREAIRDLEEALGGRDNSEESGGR